MTDAITGAEGGRVMVTWAFTTDGLAFWRGGEQIAMVPIDSLPALIVGAAQRLQERSRHGS